MSLYQRYLDYLNQAMPDISGIFRSTPAQAVEETTEETVAQPVGLTPEQLALLYPQQNQGGGDDGFKGGGKFGNLDLTRSKTFVKDVYDEELGDFIPTELTAYYNPTLGNFQTFDGKNINPAFTNIPLGIFGAGLDFMGLAPKTIGGYAPGKIRGFYDTPKDFFTGDKNDPPGKTPQQQMGIQSLSKTYQDIGRNRDRDDRGPSGPPSGPGESSSDAGFSGSTGSKSSSKNSSQAGGSFNELGFSDIRLKENIELIGKSSSNINIYKFNYKDNPTTYQGVMAHEVPWASIKHSNGYMMVDYNKIDVEFKKWQR
tara:strand:+ start:33 stop:971 length:939 start_codon:yes stop_codon:yes gene_type:complete